MSLFSEFSAVENLRQQAVYQNVKSAKHNELEVLRCVFPGCSFEQSKGRNKLWDIKLIDQAILVEVKCDFASKKYSNLFLEIFNTSLNEPSGLAGTSASLWLHYADKTKLIYSFAPAAMLTALQNSSFTPVKNDGQAGDGNALGYIVPILWVCNLQFVTTLVPGSTLNLQ